MNQNNHDRIAQQAHQLWQERGCPDGCDTEIWLEAERQLNAGGPAASSPAARAVKETAAESMVEYHISPAVNDQEAIQAALMKKDERTPQTPRHEGPKNKPPVTGKPLWQKTHSS